MMSGYLPVVDALLYMDCLLLSELRIFRKYPAYHICCCLLHIIREILGVCAWISCQLRFIKCLQRIQGLF